MKKLMMIASLILCVVLAGCAASQAEVADTAEPTAAPLIVDLDLSELSGTVVYAQVYNIMIDPNAYIGKVIKMAGYYSPYEDTARGVVYHACVIPDATACCEQGIEFVWAGEHAYPADYPAAGTDIVVTGRLESYIEGEYMYLHLVDASLTWGNAA